MALPRLRALDFAKVWTGERGDIRMSPEVARQYREDTENKDELSVKRKTHLERYFREFCDNDDYGRRLNDEKFKKEGNFRDGRGSQVAIYAFKAWKWRMYGALMTVAQRRCFVGVTVDPEKKRNKADRAKLESAAKAIAELAEYRS